MARTPPTLFLCLLGQVMVIWPYPAARDAKKCSLWTLTDVQQSLYHQRCSVTRSSQKNWDSDPPKTVLGPGGRLVFLPSLTDLSLHYPGQSASLQIWGWKWFIVSSTSGSAKLKEQSPYVLRRVSPCSTPEAAVISVAENLLPSFTICLPLPPTFPNRKAFQGSALGFFVSLKVALPRISFSAIWFTFFFFFLIPHQLFLEILEVGSRVMGKLRGGTGVLEWEPSGMGMVGSGVSSGVHQESLGLKDQREELGLRQRVSTRAVLPLRQVR